MVNVHNPIRIAVIGFGFVGSVFHAHMIDQTDGLELAAVVTPSPKEAQNVRDNYPGARIYEKVDDFFADIDQYDAVSIGTPNSTHVELATRVMEAGKPVVVDKPAAESGEEARKIVDASKRTGIPATVFQNRRYDSEILSAAKYLKELDLGDIVRFESRYRFFRPEVETGWREQKPQGRSVGTLFDLGAHTLDQAIQLFGPVKSIYGEVETLRKKALVPDDFFIAATHDNGVITHISGGLLSSVKEPRLYVQGTKGSFQINSQDPEEDQLKAGMKISDPRFGVMPDPTVHYMDLSGAEHVLPAVPGRQVTFYEGWRDFLNGKGDIPVKLEDSVHVLELLDKVIESSEQHKVFEV